MLDVLSRVVLTIKHPRKWDVLSMVGFFTGVAEIAWDVTNLLDVYPGWQKNGMFCPGMFGTTRRSSYEHRLLR